MSTENQFQVTFPQRQSSVRANVVRSELTETGKIAVVAESTPFHPVDFTWPDQPADRGSLQVDGLTLEVKDCLTGAIKHESNEFYVGSDIPARKGDDGWSFVVVHLVDSSPETENLMTGAEITLTIDAHYQQQLSLGHTACHLSAMALNQAIAPFWRKIPSRKDALDRPDFDQMAIVSSQIQPGSSRDHYRIGKTIRKKGLLAAEMIQDLPQLMAATEQQVNSWLTLGSPIEINCEGGSLTDRRYWHCHLGEDGYAVIPCGGTHARNLQELGAVRVSAELLTDTEFVMVTEVISLQ
ncbi:hypothetical protein M3P05_04310 [Sansalvadorimonas sp. 2012CJ34-2]|uniref:Metal-dependent hydrolase n=1 Tax=Parendozoicomonas callyspongiae TaxID=2942213 RepID=A0ABT0PD31_9GAMM|nr:hypothetical protein [Sansalvadorimonas sp. 2012CJ34-2]MCL6269166.1 hypothetical protein [Sansalvadorimonas sp. 2012CJ34-2]